MMTAQQRTARSKLVRYAIQADRDTAQATRALWPTDDDQLHSKVERIQQALTRLGKADSARRIAQAHGAAWRKQKRLLVQEFGRSHGLPYGEDGDMTSAEWWGRAEDAEIAAQATAQTARQIRALANTTGPSSATLGLIDAAYWATKEADDELWEAQGNIPHCDEALELFTRCERAADRLQHERDELVSWAYAHGHTITR